MSNIIEYASKATALRGVARLGVSDKTVAATLAVQVTGGKWAVDVDAVNLALGIDPELSEADQEMVLNYGHHECPGCGVNLDNGVSDYDGMVDRHGEKGAHEHQQHEWACLGCGHQWGAEIAKPSTGGGRKAPTRHYTNRSTVDGPCGLVWDIAEANPEMARKTVIATAVEQGVAFYTARTQYQKWFKAKAAK